MKSRSCSFFESVAFQIENLVESIPRSIMNEDIKNSKETDRLTRAQSKCSKHLNYQKQKKIETK